MDPENNGNIQETPVSGGTQPGSNEVIPSSTPTSTPPPPMVDASALATQFASELGKHFPKVEAASQPKQQLSPEEQKRLLNIWEPDDSFVTEFGNLETQKAAFTKMRDGLLRQFDTVAQVRAQQMYEQMQQQVAPVLTNFQQFQAQQQHERFTKDYPDLANPALAPVVQAATQSLLSSGQRFPTEAKAFEAVATAVEAAIKVHNPQFSLKKGAVVPVPHNGNQIPVTTPGGGAPGQPASTSGKSWASQHMRNKT